MAACAGKATQPFTFGVLLAGILAGSACTFPGYAIEKAVPLGGMSAGATGGVGGAAGAAGSDGGVAGATGSGGASPMAGGGSGGSGAGPAIPCTQLVSGPELSEVAGVDGLVAWYRFFDAEDMGADASGDGNHAVSSSKVEQTSDEQRGCVARFEGDGELVLPPLAPTHATFSLWLRTEVSGRGMPGDPWHVGSGLLDAEQPASVNDFGLCLVASLAAFGVGNPDQNITGTTELTDGVWHHVAATRDDATGAMLLYVDGAVEAQGTGPTGARDAVTGIHVGRGRLVADVADVRIYSRVLSAQEIASIPSGN